MRSKTNNLKVLFAAMLCCFGLIVFAVMSNTTEANALPCESDDRYGMTEQYYVLGDILEGSTGQYYNLEQDHQAMLAQAGMMQPLAIQSENDCDTHSANCGPGRESVTQGGGELCAKRILTYKTI
jgi:hypothetical protein